MRIHVEVEDVVRNRHLRDFRIDSLVHIEWHFGSLSGLLGLLYLLLEFSVMLLEKLIDLELMLVANLWEDELEVAAHLGLALLALYHQ